MDSGKDGKPKPQEISRAAKGRKPTLRSARRHARTAADVKIPIVIVEGEKKALALWRFANHESTPRFIPVAIAGVWNWKGKIGKTGGPKGERLDVHGPIADLSRIEWRGRVVVHRLSIRTSTRTKACSGQGRESARNLRSARRKGETRQSCLRTAASMAWMICSAPGVQSESLSCSMLRFPAPGFEVVLPPQFQSRPEGMFRITIRRWAVPDSIDELPGGGHYEYPVGRWR